ncbi:MAG TPA: ferredoxin--NADP reductase [Planctomycetota bacterium]|nr:ferredoxin--NADP reductase [Planctomycetota bacterium]
MADEQLNATVLARRDLTERLAVVRVAPRGWELPDFLPGQCATLGLPDPDGPGKFLRRVYSVASAPGAGHLEFYIQLVREGQFTTRLWHQQEGDAIFLSPRLIGRFTLADVPDEADLLFLGTGTGLAPYVSMLRAYRGSGRWRRCAVVHGARTQDELGYRAELLHWCAEERELAYVPTLTREPHGAWDGARGRLQQLLQEGELERRAGFALDPARCHVFLCGHPGMIDEMEQLLMPRGFHFGPQGNLHFERYW